MTRSRIQLGRCTADGLRSLQVVEAAYLVTAYGMHCRLTSSAIRIAYGLLDLSKCFFIRIRTSAQLAIMSCSCPTLVLDDAVHGLASKTKLNVVCVARRNFENPADNTISLTLASPA